MNQPSLFDGDQHTATLFVESRPDLFRSEFKDWLLVNWHIWEGFKREANRVWDRHRDHYSARTIVHWLRHETALSEAGGEFKVNNNYSPDLGRLWECFYPQRIGFFEKRERKAA